MYYTVQMITKNIYVSEGKLTIRVNYCCFFVYDFFQCSLITWKDWYSTYCHMKQYHKKYMSLNARVELTVCHR